MLNSAQLAFQAATALWLSRGIPGECVNWWKYPSQGNDLEIPDGEERFVHGPLSFCPKSLIKE